MNDQWRIQDFLSSRQWRHLVVKGNDQPLFHRRSKGRSGWVSTQPDSHSDFNPNSSMLSEHESEFFLSSCRCSMWTLNWIRFRTNINEHLQCSMNTSVSNLTVQLESESDKAALKVRSHGTAAAMAFLPQWDQSVHTVWLQQRQITVKTVLICHCCSHKNGVRTHYLHCHCCCRIIWTSPLDPMQPICCGKKENAATAAPCEGAFKPGSTYDQQLQGFI